MKFEENFDDDSEDDFDLPFEANSVIELEKLYEDEFDQKLAESFEEQLTVDRTDGDLGYIWVDI